MTDPLRALLALSRAMHAGHDARATYEVIVKEAVGFLRADRAALFVRDPASSRLTVLASKGLSPAYLDEVDRYYERSAGGLAAVLRQPMPIADVLADPRIAPELREAAGREGFRAQLILPLGQAGAPIGGLTLYWDAPPTGDGSLPVDVDLAQLFGDQAGVALGHAFALDAAQGLAGARLAELESTTKRLNAALEDVMQVERLKGDFLSAVSHELRTPLTTIVGFAEFLEEDIAGPLVPAQRRYVVQILEAAGHLTTLVDDLLDFARMEAGQVKLDAQAADVRPILADVVNSLESAATNRGIEVALELDEALPEAVIDPPRLRQVALNLASNAVKFTPAGGKVTIRAREAGGGVRVEVRDTGIGIPDDALPHLFKKFFRVEGGLTAATKGTGLGLAIAKQLVEAMDGAIGVDSRLGAGSTFWFEVPAA